MADRSAILKEIRILIEFSRAQGLERQDNSLLVAERACQHDLLLTSDVLNLERTVVEEVLQVRRKFL
jgi:hypothetical protein